MQKVSSPKIQTRGEATHTVQRVAHLTVLLGCAAAAQSADVCTAQEKHQPLINQLSLDISAEEERLRVWAQSHRKEFEGAQSLEFPNGFLRFRLSGRSLELLEGFTWKTVLAALKGPFKIYRRIKHEPDKAALLKDSAGDKPRLTPERLAKIGVEVEQGEAFEVECKPEASI